LTGDTLNTLRNSACLLLVAILAGCGGGGSAASGSCTLGGGPGCGGSVTTPPPTGSPPPDTPTPTPVPDPALKVASVGVVTSSPELASSGLPGTELTVTALLKSADNVGVAGAKVEFAADSGFLSVVSATSDASGKAVATLGTGGSPLNRTIKVSARVGSQAGSATVNVSGTHLVFNAPPVLAVGASATVTATLLDSAGRPISGAPLGASAKLGNGISLLAQQTDGQGAVPVMLTAAARGSEEFTLSGLGATLTRAVSVTGSDLALAPAIGTAADGAELLKEVTIGSCTPIDATSATNGSGSITFATSRGALYTNSACTQALAGALAYAGGAVPRVWLRSDVAGIATVEGVLGSGARASTRIEYVAPLRAGARLDLQADQSVVGTGERSTIVAVVRDGSANNNPVKGATVQFSLAADPSNGALLAPLSAVTGSDGVARAVFVAGPLAGGDGATVVQARLPDLPGVTGSAGLTVNRKALSVQFGTGNKIILFSAAVLQQDFAVFVADNAGNPVKDVAVSAAAWAVTYSKGAVKWVPNEATTLEPGRWIARQVVTCANEDVARKGVYERALDTNGNGVLDPGVPLTVTVSGRTDAMGMATVSLRYPADRAFWNQVELTVSALVAGTEGHARGIVTLPGLASDYVNLQVPPPGATSPYGMLASCATTD
jgi:hypothetical protein